jgi:hypothetical protein
MVGLDLTVMNIALPSAQRALDFTTADRQWVVTVYTLAFGSLLPPGGRRRGRRRRPAPPPGRWARSARVGRRTRSGLAGTVVPVTDRAAPMSMFDYDARPVTPLPARGCLGPASLRSAQRGEQHPHQQGGHPGRVTAIIVNERLRF